MANLWQTIRDEPDGLAKEVLALRPSEHLFNEISRRERPECARAKRAAEYMYWRYSQYCGRHTPRPKYLPPGGSDYRADLIAESVRHWSRYLQGVRFTCLDFEDAIEAEDGPRACHVLDPVYPRQERYYRFGFELEDHERLARRVQRVRGKAVVYLPDLPEVREWYGWADWIVPVPLLATAGHGANTTVPRLLILANYARRELPAWAVAAPARNTAS